MLLCKMYNKKIGFSIKHNLRPTHTEEKDMNICLANIYNRSLPHIGSSPCSSDREVSGMAESPQLAGAEQGETESPYRGYTYKYWGKF